MRIFSRATLGRWPVTMALTGAIALPLIAVAPSQTPAPTPPASTGTAPHSAAARAHRAAPIRAQPASDANVAARRQLLRAIVFGGGPGRPFGFFK